MKYYLSLICGVLIWAVINGLALRGVHVPSAVLGTFMSLVGVLLFLPWLLIKKPKFTKIEIKLLCLLGVAAALNNSFFYAAIKFETVKGSQAFLIHYFSSILAVLWISCIPAFKEKLDIGSILGIIMGAVGLIIATGNDWLKHEFWMYLALLSAFFYSFEIVLSRRVSDVNIHPNVSSFAKLFFQALLMPFVGVYLLNQQFVIPEKHLFVQIIGAGFLLFLSFILVFSGLKKVPAKHFAVIGYLDRIGAIAIFALVFGERFGWNVWLGGALVLLAEIPILISSRKAI